MPLQLNGLYGIAEASKPDLSERQPGNLQSCWHLGQEEKSLPSPLRILVKICTQLHPAQYLSEKKVAEEPVRFAWKEHQMNPDYSCQR